MAYKVIDGVVYEVKEVDVSDLKEEVEKVIADVDAVDRHETLVRSAADDACVQSLCHHIRK